MGEILTAEVAVLSPEGIPPLGLPLPVLSRLSTVRSSLVCAVSPIGANGRLPDRICLRELGWSPGTPVEFAATSGVVVVTHADTRAGHCPDVGQCVDSSGHLRLLTITRRVAGFVTGERLLVAADRERQILRILTMASLSVLVDDRWDMWSRDRFRGE